MGLACSHKIVQKMGGDIILKESKRGLTVFGFKIPVIIKDVKGIDKIDIKSI